MYRSVIYGLEQGRSFDILTQEKDILAALGALEISLTGQTTTVVAGLAATASIPTSLVINLAQGWLYQQAQMDSTAFGSLAADLTTVQQQGIAAAQTVTLSTVGLVAGQSQWALIQAQFSQTDAIRTGDPTGGVLYFYNAVSPSTPFQGPGNTGATSPTVRQSLCILQVIYGSPASTGSEIPPNPTAGWVPLYLVDLTFGQTQITQGQILTAGPSVGSNVPNNYPGAPFIAGLLNSHHSGGAGNAPKIKLTSEVQGILPLSNLPASSANTGGGLSTTYVYAGNPNGHVAGVAALVGTSPPDTCWDTTDGEIWYCTTTGNAASAVWALSGSGVGTGTLYVGTDTGGANAMVANTSPTFTTPLNSMVVEIDVAAANTSATVTFKPNGGTTYSVVRADGTPLLPNDLQPAPYRALMAYDLVANKWLLLNPCLWASQPAPQKISANLTLYVATTGSDSNNGLTPGTPFLTLQKAWNVLVTQFNLNGFTATIQVADGTYTGGLIASSMPIGVPGLSSIVINGDNATPGNVIINTTGNCISASGPVGFVVQNMELTSSAGNCIYAASGAAISMQGILFGTATGNAHMAAQFGGSVTAIGNYTVAGSAAFHWSATLNGSIIVNSKTVTGSGAPAFSSAFAGAGGNGSIQAVGDTFTSVGGVTGPRYSISGNATVYTNGQPTTYLPGNSAGATNTGGQYY